MIKVVFLFTLTAAVTALADAPYFRQVQIGVWEVDWQGGSTYPHTAGFDRAAVTKAISQLIKKCDDVKGKLALTCIHPLGHVDMLRNNGGGSPDAGVQTITTIDGVCSIPESSASLASRIFGTRELPVFENCLSSFEISKLD